ncbi:catabolic 3-dehydroquinase [Violaceomyces palustris]|uniref:Catabolic 3-dehydroquinase n=1 Tax=Violaceomyces palustris TaxID=1673888 RepID=A0ACD0NXV7_9BASI|nr:catabolic 3-dehydroquinase [Violaceomyces palustris]
MSSQPADEILLINGPNLNLLGTREPEKYGAETLSDVVASCEKRCQSLGYTLSSFQSNHEGEILDRIHSTKSDKRTVAVVINAGAYTHTSVAIRDSLLAVGLPFVEVHITNVHAREPFRHHSYLSDVASGVIVGLGTFGYQVAIDHIAKNLVPSKKK